MPEATPQNSNAPQNGVHKVALAEAFPIALGHYEAGRDAQAANICRKIIAAQPRHARALHLLGLIVYKKGNNQRALELIEQAVRLRPDLAEFHNSQGMVCMVLGRYSDALTAYKQTLRLLKSGQQADLPKLYSNIANALQLLGRFDEAIRFHEHALSLNPDDMVATWNLSHIHLIRGDFLRGWVGFNRRFELPSATRKFYTHRYDVPLWDGSDFSGKRLFIHEEQGHGDIIQFARYLPLVKARGGTVILEVRENLLDLFRTLPGVDELVERKPNTRSTLSFDLYAPLLSLPGILGTTVETIPAPIPYLDADPDRVAAWTERLGGEGLKVGLVWTGNLRNIPLRHRACKLRYFEPLLRVDGVRFFGLQKGEGSEQIEDLPEHLRFINYGEEFKDFADTAAAISPLDLVITIDTAVAHLAGAMGKPVWLLLAYPPDWRWLLDREDCPWYPTMRLFRQTRPGAWSPVFDRVVAALHARLDDRQ